MITQQKHAGLDSLRSPIRRASYHKDESCLSVKTAILNLIKPVA